MYMYYDNWPIDFELSRRAFIKIEKTNQQNKIRNRIALTCKDTCPGKIDSARGNPIIVVKDHKVRHLFRKILYIYLKRAFNLDHPHEDKTLETRKIDFENIM